MKNQFMSQDKSIKDYKENAKKYNQDSLVSSKVSGQSNKQQNQEGKNLLAVVKLDIGEGQSDVIKYYQGDDIIQVVSNFCQQYELEEKCIAHIVANIKQQINKAQSQEMMNRIQKQQKELAMLEQQQSVQSSEKEEIQSQSTNTSSKQNYFQFNPFSPRQVQLDQYSQNSVKQSINKEKQTFLKNGVEQSKIGKYKRYKEDELDSEYNSDYNQQEFQQIQQFKQSQDLNLKTVKKATHSQIDDEHKRKREDLPGVSQERKKSRNEINKNHEDESPQNNNSFVGGQNQQGHQNQQGFMQRQSFIKNDELLMQENYEKWHKYTELKKNLNAKPREDLPNLNRNNPNIMNAYDDKRTRSQSQISASNSQNISRKNTLNNVEYNNCSDDDQLDEYQILEKIRNEGLLPNNLTKSQIKTMIITNGNNRISPQKRKNNLQAPGTSSFTTTLSSSFVDSKQNKINKQLSNIEEIQNSSASNNTSRLENTAINNSLKSSFAPNISTYINTNSNSFVQSNTNLNTTKNEEFYKNNKNISKTPTRNSKKSEEQISPLQNRSNSRPNITQNIQKQHNQPQQSQQKKLNIPILDIKKAQTENSYSSLAKQYPQTSRSPTVSTHKEQSQSNDDFQKYLRGNQTGREHNQKNNQTPKQSEQQIYNQKSNYNSQQFSKILLSDRVKQQTHQSQNPQKQKDLSQSNSYVKTQDCNGSVYTENNSYMRSSQNQNPEFNTNQQSDNILKIDLESYKRQKKNLTNPPLTDRPKNKDEQNYDGFQQQMKLQGKIDKNNGTISYEQQESSRSPHRDVSSYIQEYDLNHKHKTKFTQENSFLDQQMDRSVVSSIINSSKSPATSTQQKNEQLQNSKGIYMTVKQQPEQKQKNELSNQNDFLVNRLLKQKDAAKISDQQQQAIVQKQEQLKQSQKKLEPTQNVQQQSTQNSQLQSNKKYNDFTQFLHKKIFSKMDSDGDGFISVTDVEINTLKTDILEIIQNFLIEMADDSSIQYSFSLFVDFINNHKSILDSLKQIYMKKYSTNSSQQNLSQKQIQKPQQSIQQLQQVQLIENPKQQLTQGQQFSSQQQQQINKYQLPQFANIQQTQGNNIQNGKTIAKEDVIQQQNFTNNDVQQYKNKVNNQIGIQSQQNQDNLTKQQNQNYNKEKQSPFMKVNEINQNLNFIDLKNQISFQPQQQQNFEIEQKLEDAPITHFIDVTKHVKNKQQDISSQHQQYNHPNTYGNVQQVPTIPQNELVNFSFSEDVQNHQQKLSSNYNQIHPPYLNNTSPKDLNTSSQNHSPQFEQTKAQNMFGINNNTFEKKKNENAQIGQDLLISFSNQSIPYHEPQFGLKNDQYQAASSFKGNSNHINQSQPGSINPPQIISGRYKNLVQKKFNHTQNQN